MQRGKGSVRIGGERGEEAYGEAVAMRGIEMKKRGRTSPPYILSTRVGFPR